ncbi:MAG: hypothetical protein KJ663_04145, partial [Proteobacteria bacterium]|nr:hypothetical protein [Pseudomonadota bacterium]
ASVCSEPGSNSQVLILFKEIALPFVTCIKGPTNQLSHYSISKEPVRNEPIELKQISFPVKNNFQKLASHCSSIFEECQIYNFYPGEVKRKFKFISSNHSVNE